jgi:anti-anti-sigma factor
MRAYGAGGAPGPLLCRERTRIEGGETFAVTVGCTGDVPLLRVRGVVDASSASVLAAVLRPVLKCDPSSVVIDVDAAVFVDVAGVAALKQVISVAESRAHLIVRAETQYALRIVRLAGLGDRLESGAPDLG